MRTVFVVVILAVLGCNSKPSTSQRPSQVPRKPSAASAGTKAPATSAVQSINLPVLLRIPDFSLTDQSGAAFGSSHLHGKACIINFIFTRCKATCPEQTAKLAALQEQLKSHKHWKDIRLVSVTVDPAFDTPEVLQDYAQLAKAEQQNWKFLTGSEEAIFRLSTQGFKLPVEVRSDSSQQPITHSPKFALVDPQGHVRGYYESGAEAEMEKLRADLDTVLNERVLIFDDLLDPSWVESRRNKQGETAGKFAVFRDFSFTDRQPESRITFRHRIVDDAGREHKPVHYDHGTGVAVADVDADGLLDIYFVNQIGNNELWKNRGDGTFENITESSGVANNGKIHVSASFADIDNDGDADLYLTNVRGENTLYENDGHGKFRDITRASGLGYNGHSSSAVFFDYNRDGKLDLFLVNVGVYTTNQTATVVNDRFTGPDTREYSYRVAFLDAFAGHLKPERLESSVLYENQGGNRFVNVSRKVDLVDNSWSGDASPFDANDDGWPDLYVLNMQGHNEYYENDMGKRFIKKSRELFPATPWGAMGIKVFDFDNDGRMDIFITDMHIDMGEPVDPMNEKQKSRKEQFLPQILATDGNHIWGNALFHKQPDGSFQEISDRIGAETYWPWGLSVGDLNADGYDDVFITGSMNFPFRYGVNSLLLNNRGKEFLDAEYLLGIEPRRGGRTAIPWFELDAAGRDKELAKKYQPKSGNMERLVAWGALGSRSSVMLDIDNDGDLDIVTNDLNSEPMVLVSNLTVQQKAVNFLQVHLIGKQSNRDGLGAKVKVITPDQTLTKVHDGKSGYLSQSSYPLYFGLGDANTVERIEILWPSGQEQTLSAPIKTNSLIEISEP